MALKKTIDINLHVKITGCLSILLQNDTDKHETYGLHEARALCISQDKVRKRLIRL